MHSGFAGEFSWISWLTWAKYVKINTFLLQVKISKANDLGDIEG